MHKKYTHDIGIIGAGAGGLVVAAVAANLKHKVVLFEKGEMGGDCLNYGCVPSKALLAAAASVYNAQSAEKFGVHSAPKVDFTRVMAHVKRTIAAIAPHDSQQRFEGLGVDVIRAEATFSDAHTLSAGGRQYRPRRIVIATGSSPFVPPIPGLQDVPFLTNETLFNLEELPRHLLVLGGGPIGLEMAQAFTRLGSKVSVIEAASSILPRDDAEAAALVAEHLASEDVTLYTSSKVTQVSATNGITLNMETPRGAQNISGSHLLLATGRAPNVDGLNLAAAGVNYMQRGISVNSSQRTSRKHIYAVGDVTGQHPFTHMAGDDAGIVLKRLIFGKPFASNKNRILPWATYTSPQVAQVGMTETAAKTKFGQRVTATKVAFSALDRAHTDVNTSGFIKVITGRGGKLLGVTVVGANAAEHLPLWTYMLQHNQPLKNLSSVIVAYPTYGELAKRVVSAYYKDVIYGSAMQRYSRWAFRLIG